MSGHHEFSLGFFANFHTRCSGAFEQCQRAIIPNNFTEVALDLVLERFIDLQLNHFPVCPHDLLAFPPGFKQEHSGKLGLQKGTTAVVPGCDSTDHLLCCLLEDFGYSIFIRIC